MINTLPSVGRVTAVSSTMDEWIRQLASLDWQERVGAAKKLAKAGQAAVPYLISAATSELFLVRYSAVWSLGKIGTEDVLQPVCDALSDEHWAVRETAARTLGDLTHLNSKYSVTYLMNCTGDEDKRVRLAAIEALGQLSSRRKKKAT